MVGPKGIVAQRDHKYVATLRPKSIPKANPVDGVATKGKLSSPLNKRNATYLNKEEYDEDLAQLDMLLHYVNNLSASLEFLQWGNKRISTDLMPTLLGMYDAMYAKLSMNDDEPAISQFETSKSQPPKESLSSQLTDRSPFNNDLDSTRGDSMSEGSCEFCGVQCICKESRSNSVESPESLSFVNSRQQAMLPELTDRPVSSISSSSSSSSSSPPRRPAGSCMASVESLEENANIAETTRRRDRKIIKARREKLRTGSSDSGVQCHSISLPAPSTLRRRYCDPDLTHMDRMVLEVLETEEMYVQDLKEVIEGYLNYWKANPQHEIEIYQLENLFSNIEEIYTFNREFLAKLSACGTDPVCVARSFVRHNRGFAIYTDYCTNYPRTVSVLTDLMRNEKTMRSCRERQLALGHTLPLGSYLLKPVQRVLKYHLLLGNIIKNFPKEQLGYDDIWDAHSAMTGMAHHINDMKRKHEHSVRVQEIQSVLYDWSGEDLTIFGELAAEGTFRTRRHKGGRHLLLFDKILIITKKKDENTIFYKSHILCSNLMLIEAIPGEPFSFQIIAFDNPRHQYTLECRSHEEKREWTQQLKRVILENYAADIPAHARQLVMELGQAKSAELNIEHRISRRTHHAPEYLEKRKDRRRASEVGLKRNKSPTRNNPKNRSSSCTRASMRKISASSLSPFEIKQLRLPLWRRRSEPTDDIPITAHKVIEPCSKLPDNLSEICDTDNVSESHDDSVTDDRENTNESKTTEPVAAKEENLHEIVTHLLQHRLEMQKKILNKQRRNLVSKKQVSSCHASDAEDDRPPLPISPPPTETSTKDSSEWPSAANSMYSSTNSLLHSTPKSNDAQCQKSRDVNSNYDNVNEMWDTLWSKFPPGDPVTPISNGGHALERNSSLAEVPTYHEETFTKERPKTVVSADSAIDAYNILNNYLTQSKRKDSHYKFPYKVPEANSDFPEYLYYSEEEGPSTEIHPNHKIYKRLPLNKGNIRKILGRLTSPRGHHKSNGELSSVSGRSIDTCSVSSNKTSIVSTVAKHYSKALREKVRQMTQDDESKKAGGDKAIGARLASHEESEYAVPSIKNSSGSRPDSVLSSSSFRTCSSSSSGLPSQKPDFKTGHLDETTTQASNTGDNYYERSFDATEFEQDLFRDSAIYSDPEDTDVSLSPLSSFRIKNPSRKLTPIKITQALNRHSSFRHSCNFGGESPGIQRPKQPPPPVPARPTQLEVPGNSPSTRLTPKLSTISSLHNNSRVSPVIVGNSCRRKEFVLKNGWVKHIVDKLQEPSD